MSRRWLLLLLCVAVLGGCRKKTPGGGRTHEAVVRDAIASLRTVTTALNGAQDAGTAEKAAQRVRREVETLRALRQEMGGLGKASEAERRRVKQHDPEVIEASQAVQQTASAVAGRAQQGAYPAEVGARLVSAVKDYGEAMTGFAQQAAQLVE